MTALRFTVRPGRESDHPFVYSSFLQSFRKYNRLAELGTVKCFQVLHAEMERHLQVLALSVACDPEDDDSIFGWAVSAPGKLAYCYTKSLYRSQGVASRLVTDSTGGGSVSYFYATGPGQKLLRSIAENGGSCFEYELP